MIKTLKPIIISENKIYDHYLNNNFSNVDDDWKIRKSEVEDETLIECDSFTQDYDISAVQGKVNWKLVSNNEIQLPPPNWILAKLYSLSNLLDSCIIYHFVPYFSWVLQVNHSEIVIVKLDNINTVTTFYYQVQIIDIECINYPTCIFEITVDV